MLTVKVSDKPAWMDDFMWGKLIESGGCVANIDDFETRCLARNIDIVPSDWAAKYRKLQTGPLAGSFWSKELTPYLPDIMDATFLKCVRRINICKSPQVGGSVLIETMLGYVADKIPGPCLLVFPDEATAKKNCRERLRPMFMDSPRLSRMFTHSDYRVTDKAIRLPHMNITLGWAGSPISVGNISVRFLFLDELDKYVCRNKNETSPDLNAEKRITAYPYDHKIIKNSTPTIEDGVTWRSFINSCILVYRAVCPKCRKAQVMNFDQIKWDGDDPEKIIENKSAWYECVKCGKKWDDGMRDLAVMDGYWTPGGYDFEAERWIDKKLRKRNILKYISDNEIENIGFHIPAWISPFVFLSTIVASHLKSEGDENARKDFCNNFKGEPWRPKTKKKVTSKLEKLKDERPRGQLPSIHRNKIICLTAAIDTQDNGFFYEVRAWRERGRGSWGIKEGFLPPEKDILMNTIFADYVDPDGVVMNVRAACIDSGGHKTAEVYDLCRGEYRNILIPIKGVQKATNPFRVSNIDYYPGTQKKIKGGLGLWIIDTTYYKNLLSNRLDINPNDLGAWWFHSELSDEWLRMLTSEEQDENGFWITKRKANHYWDLCVYHLFMCDRLGIKFFRYQDINNEESKKRRRDKKAREAKEKHSFNSLW